jgi:hypothetical protein
MSNVLMAIALLSGLFTVVFILAGLRSAFVRHQKIGLRALLLTTVFSLLTGGFTLWQLVSLLQQLHLD